MDLKISANFIKERRKELSLTQSEISEKIGVSEKTVSKWECAKGFPDTSLILPLCDALKITANELLSGKKLTADEYKEHAENNLVKLEAKNEKLSRLLLTIEIVFGIIMTVLFVGIVFLASFCNIPDWLRIVIIVVGFLLLLFGLCFLLLIEKDVGFYECQNCHHKHVPTFKQVLFAMHMNRTRFMKCPKCGKKSWQKKVLK